MQTNPYQTPLAESQLPVYQPGARVWKWRFFLALRILGASLLLLVFCAVCGWMILENELPQGWLRVLGIPLVASYIAILLGGVLGLISGILWLIYYVAERRMKKFVSEDIDAIRSNPHQRESSDD